MSTTWDLHWSKGAHMELVVLSPDMPILRQPCLEIHIVLYGPL